MIGRRRYLLALELILDTVEDASHSGDEFGVVSIDPVLQWEVLSRQQQIETGPRNALRVQQLVEDALAQQDLGGLAVDTARPPDSS